MSDVPTSYGDLGHVQPLTLAAIEGLEDRYDELLTEVNRVFDAQSSYVEKSKRITVRVVLTIDHELDVESGGRTIAFTSDVKLPKRRGRKQPLYRHGGHFLVRDEPVQMALADVHEMKDARQAPASEGSLDTAAVEQGEE